MKMAVCEHARDQMEAREITMDQVRTALRYPDATMPGGRRRRTRVHKNLGPGRDLRVIFEERKNGNRLVVTVYWKD